MKSAQEEAAARPAERDVSVALSVTTGNVNTTIGAQGTQVGGVFGASQYGASLDVGVNDPVRPGNVPVSLDVGLGAHFGVSVNASHGPAGPQWVGVTFHLGYSTSPIPVQVSAGSITVPLAAPAGIACAKGGQCVP